MCKIEMNFNKVKFRLGDIVLNSVAMSGSGLAIERARVRIPFATVSKFEHFRSLCDASVHSAV